MTEWFLLTYGSLKVAAYIAVCWIGLRWVGRRQRFVPPAALGLGILRAAMGLVFGVGIFFASAWVVAASPVDGRLSLVLAYLAVYVPTRWVEWSLIALFLTPGARAFGGFWLGSGREDRLWRVLGICVSCAADVPVLLAVGGLPIGRFMC